MPTKTNISGFPEFLPSEQLAFDAIVAKITAIYQSFGYVPLETAAVERIDTLTSKGIDSKEVYALRRLNAQGDDGDKDIALRFDLTVPLARYVSQNYANLVFPYRRYQVQPVFRGERPQLGRYRQFHQFDLDVLTDGANSLPLEADAEVIAAAYTAIKTVLPKDTDFTMRINNRKILKGWLGLIGFHEDTTQKAIKIVDDLDKVGFNKTKELLKDLRKDNQNNSDLFLDAFLDSGEQAIDDFIFKAHNLIGNLNDIENNDIYTLAAKEFLQGVKEIENVNKHLKQLLNSENLFNLRILMSPTIARGLDYYTGTVVETRLEPAPELGSICSGGRYDNLTASLSDRHLPGVGVSIGISRLAAWLMSQPPYNTMAATTAKVIVTGSQAASVCQTLRAGGIAAELALGDKPAVKHFQTAEKRGIAFGIVAEPDSIQLRTFATRSSEPLDAANLVAHVKETLAN